jgi:hypothetical protein
LALLMLVADKQKTARQAAALFAREYFDKRREVHEKWDGDRFHLVDGEKWYRAEIVKAGIAIHSVEGGGT